MTLRHEAHPEHIYRMLEQTLIPPTTVQELDPDVIESAVGRLADTEGTVSESYLVNSELTTADLKRLPSPREAMTIQDYFFTTSAEGYEKSRGTRWARSWAAEDVLGQLLSPSWTDPVTVQALYGVDLVVLRGTALWRQVPGRAGAMFEQNVGRDFRERLGDAVPGTRAEPLEGAVLLLVGSHVRMQFLHGVQAVRGLMYSAGTVAGSLASRAVGLGMSPRVISHFNNSAVNRLVEVDGVDRAVVTIMTVSDQKKEGPQ